MVFYRSLKQSKEKKRMGKATRWLRGLLGMKKVKENMEKNSQSGEKKEKKRWSFGKSGKDSGGFSQIPVNDEGIIPSTDTVWLRNYISETEKEQNKHAIAVAAATAAAADAAVAAAHAAVAVIRLTSQGRETLFNGGREKYAATKIQTVFRGYLARKALRALRGLVKLQALVRGYLVRKRAAETLHSMQALIRAQAAIRSQRARRSINSDYRSQPEIRTRKSIERFEETKSEYHSKRISSSYDHSLYLLDESPKIVEIDTCRPKSRSRRMNGSAAEYGDDQYYQAISSPLPCPMPNRSMIPDCRHLKEFDWGCIAEDYKFPTAHSTPRFAFSIRANKPATPAKSVCGDTFFKPYSDCPNYMSNTQSFNAKLRSYSAPKQRPEPTPKKRLSLNEIMASRSSFSGVGMQKSYPQVQEDIEF